MTWSADFTAKLGDFSMKIALSGGAEPLVVIGENGSGKSTLLRILAGALPVRAGRVVLDGRVLEDSQTSTRLPPQDRRIGYVPQGYGLFPHLTAVDNVAFGLRGTARRPRAVAMLAALDCADLLERYPRQLSGGQQQRIALARALITEPALLLLDEPLSALDVAARRQVRAALTSHLSGRPSIVVTHDVRDVRALAGQVAVIEDGRVVQQGTAAELTSGPKTAFIEEFFDS